MPPLWIGTRRPLTYTLARQVPIGASCFCRVELVGTPGAGRVTVSPDFQAWFPYIAGLRFGVAYTLELVREKGIDVELVDGAYMDVDTTEAVAALAAAFATYELLGQPPPTGLGIARNGSICFPRFAHPMGERSP